jgi:hypothetical protein
MVSDSPKWNKKLVTMWKTSITKIIPSLRNYQVRVDSIMVNPCISCRSLPSCERIGKLEIKTAGKKTILR